MSVKDRKFYIGFTNDLRKRFTEHNEGKVFSTRDRGPLRLIYYEACLNEKNAIQREKYLKSGIGHKWLKNRIKNYQLTGQA